MKKNTKKESRREFLVKAWWSLGIIALLESAWVFASFMWPRKPRAKPGSFGGIIVAGAVDTFEPESVTAFRNGNFYLARLGDGGFLAISMKCTHLGCTVPWVSEEKSFRCPCHASTFDIRGEVTNPPATRALDIYPVTIENDIVRVDTRKGIKRKGFKVSQVVRS